MDHKKEEFIISRHTEKTDRRTPEDEFSTDYFGITKKGEREAREKAREIAQLIKDLPDHSVAILSGISRAIRTRSTLEIYGDELRDVFSDDESVIFPDVPEGLPDDKLADDTIYFRYLKRQLEIIKSISVKLKEKGSEGKKAIIQFPLWIKQFTASGKEWEEWRRHFSSIKNKVGDNNEIAQWIEDGQGPNPEATASDLLIGLMRQVRFFRKFFPEGELLFVDVGHSGELDALFTKLANQGRVTREGFEKIGGKEVEYNESSQLRFLSDGTIEFEYRGQVYRYFPEKED